MFKKAPHFWNEPHATPRIRCLWSALWLVQRIYLFVLRQKKVKSTYHLPIPVLCVGNVTLGGQGKTPTCLALFDLLQQNSRFLRPHFITRGYKGALRGPIRVDTGIHSYKEVGDEALLLANKGPTWKGANRSLSGTQAAQNGASCLILDDGFQNLQLFKDVSLLVIDGSYGFGNGHVFPCGPLREPLNEALLKTSGVVLVGKDTRGVLSTLALHNKDIPLFPASLIPSEGQIKSLSKKPLLAFAGIGVPQKFFSMLRSYNLQVVKTKSFSDHHPYSRADLDFLLNLAEKLEARLVTTHKDLLRIPEVFHQFIPAIDVDLRFEDPKALLDFLHKRLFFPTCGSSHLNKAPL